ncbi:ACT domain-containing protein [Streptomyces sp. NBC_00199]|uniref:ACT domain-containing protein n=1 Tax=Streptomyces sp. NBC_00199 TaxID=2975678 RepID=UPI00225663CA|nr:ACT domain-containing protein [Streptomyces sp. NBC_00199]MCX5265775.1 ACT domain-containing protein [Streptomyces sp. NBC_00199]
MAHDGNDQGNGTASDAASPGTPASRHTPLPSARTQNLRVLEGRFVLERVSDVRTVTPGPDLLALVLGPDGGAVMRRDDLAEDGWRALWNGDDAHDPEATGMLGAIVAPLAASELPVWTAASYDGDLVLVPAGRLEEAVDMLRRAGHQVVL